MTTTTTTMAPRPPPPSQRPQMLIALSLMSFASLCLHAICGFYSYPTSTPPSTAIPQDSSFETSCHAIALKLFALEASLNEFSQTISQLQSTLSQGKAPMSQHYVMSNNETVACWCIFPFFLWIIAFSIFMNGAFKWSKMYMQNTMLSAFLCANLGMMYLLFGTGDTRVNWYGYVLGILWPMQGVLAVSVFLGGSGSSGPGEESEKGGSDKND